MFVNGKKIKQENKCNWYIASFQVNKSSNLRQLMGCHLHDFQWHMYILYHFFKGTYSGEVLLFSGLIESQ